MVPVLAALACGSDASTETSPPSEDAAAATDATTTTLNDARADDAANAGRDAGRDANDAAMAIVPTRVVSGQFHSCALMSNGDVYCWGGNQAGQLGITADADAHPAPLKIAGLSNVVEIAAGGSFNCARVATGAVSCWGDNATNQLGHNGGTDAACATNFSGQACNPVPTVVAGLANVTQLAPGYQHACALTSSGEMCWGDNVGGQGGHATGSDPLCGGFCTATPTLLDPAVASITDVGAGQQALVDGHGMLRQHLVGQVAAHALRRVGIEEHLRGQDAQARRIGGHGGAEGDGSRHGSRGGAFW